MKDKNLKLIDFIKYEYLEFISFIFLILWVISPVIEMILKKYINNFYTNYFSLVIYIVGIIGFIIYGIYIIKKYKDKSITFKKSIPYLLIIILWLISLISSILSDNPSLSFFGESYRKEGLIVYTMYIGFIFLSSILNKKYINYLFKISIISALIVTIFPLFNPNFNYLNFKNVFFNTNHYGYYLMIVTSLSGFQFISSKKGDKYFYLISYIILLYMLIKNNTFGCYLALIITLVVALIYSIIKKYKIIKVLSIFIIFIFLSVLMSKFNINIGSKYNDYGDKIVSNNVSSFKKDIEIILSGNKEDFKKVGSHRGVLWMGAVQYTLDHPLIGGGFESLKVYYLKEYNTTIDRPHNMILQTSSFIGIPGAIIYLSFIIFLAISNLKNINKNSINITIYFTSMCYFISSQFGNSMFYTSPHFVILIGMLINIYISNCVDN